jgi:DNA invertase Pin-like site-specific DNA recombinase
MLIGYARVSSVGQSLEVQLEQLRGAGCEKIFAEKRSGRTAVDRPELQEAVSYAREGDALVVTRLDRLARSMIDLRQLVDDLAAKGVQFRCLQQGAIDTTRSDGKLLLNILASFAEFEADIRKERQRDGIERVKREEPEKYRGRPPSVDAARILELHGQKVRPVDIARKLGISRASVYRALPPKETGGVT